MADLGKAMKGLECCTRINESRMPDCDRCPYKSDPGAICGVQKPIKDALELLKAQDEVIQELLKVGYPHNVQFENPLIVNYMVDIAKIVRKAACLRNPLPESPKEG